jgi:hypothetical protein
MNIIRTTAVELVTIPAIAYKQKLASGGSGIKILRLDQDVTAVGTIDRRTGEIRPYGKIDEDLFPHEAFDEAMELVSGLPYSARGKIAVKAFAPADAEDVVDTVDEEVELLPEVTPESEPEQLDMTHSREYRAIVERYTDEKGKLNYTLMNKDFIQFAAKSKVVSTMVGERAHTDDIVLFVVKSRAALIAGRKDSLDDIHAAALIATLDEINPRSAFKELRAHINRMLARKR